MASNIRTKRAAVADQASDIVKDWREVGTATKRMATDSVDALRDTANEYLDEGRARVREFGDSFQSKVQEQPLKSILIATAIGFVLGAFGCGVEIAAPKFA